MLSRFMSARALHTLLMAALLVASLHAQDYAKVLVQLGRVSFTRDASGYQFALLDSTLVGPGYTIKTGADGYAKLQVSDGSTFEVFPNSEVVYRKTNSINDLLNVWLGKVKVVIQHLPGVPNPNNVTTPTALISVRGTVFDVDVEDDEGTTFVSLDEGVVDVHHLLLPSPNVRLAPGGSVRVYANQPLRVLRDHGNLMYKVYQHVQQGLYDWIYSRPGGGGNVPVGTGSGKQGDQGKNTGNGSGNGAPSRGNGAPPAAPPPPPGGGGGI
jgi:ferric-dicitrate binding protein FerR (iron transport regulator)